MIATSNMCTPGQRINRPDCAIDLERRKLKKFLKLRKFAPVFSISQLLYRQISHQPGAYFEGIFFHIKSWGMY